MNYIFVRKACREKWSNHAIFENLLTLIILLYIFYPISACGKFKTSIRSILHLKKTILRNLIDFLDKIVQKYTKSLIFLVKICKNFTFRALLQKPTSLTLMFYYTNYILRTFIDKLRWIYILKKDWYSERCYSKSNCYYGKIS